jgi:phosphoglucomutase
MRTLARRWTESGFFIYPSDALAIMALYHDAIPYFKNNWKGAARSRPTSSALDFVQPGAYAVPTGWKYFASLLDAGLISICGEESFGQGGDYIREKDGFFAVLYWLNILAATGKTARELVTDMWKKYGRVFYSQYSYENVDKIGADRVLEYTAQADLVGQIFDGHKIISKEIFNYTDPVTGETAQNQGIEIKTDDGVRIFFRLSGTGTVGATLRFYLEKHETDESKFDMRGQDYLQGLYGTVAKIFKLDEFFTPPIKPSAIN